MQNLKFGRDNAKLVKLLPYLPDYLAYLGNTDKPRLYTVSKLSGHNCPFAKDCLSKAIRKNGKTTVEDGPHTKFRCFSASQEALFPALYDARKHNTDLIREKNSSQIVKVINRSFPADCNVLRIHIGGDFATQAEFDAWLEFAGEHPSKLFYAYTKSLPFWVKRLDDIPRNLVLTASYGGWRDKMIQEYKLRYAKVVFSEDDASKLKLDIDHDDSHAANPKNKDSFALLLHGTQPKGSQAAIAWEKIRRNGGGYSRE